VTMKRGDRIMSAIFAAMIIAAISLWAVRTYVLPETELHAEIFKDGKMIRVIGLKNGARPEEFTIKSDSGFNTIRVEGNKIAVISADCPDADCVHRGWLEHAGESAVCLPHRLVIRVTGDSAVDGVTF